MATVLEAFVKLFADDTELRKSFGALPGVARQAGDKVGASFTEGINRAVTPGRATNVTPLQLQRVGGLEVDATGSPFSAGFQKFKQARELATGGAAQGVEAGIAQTGKAAAAAKKDVDDYQLSVRDAAGSVRLLGVSVISELNPALGAGASVALDAARNLRELGVGVAAGGAAAAIAAVAIGLYIAKIKEGITAQVELAQALRRGDFGAVDAQARKASDGIGAFEKQAQLANQSVDDVHSASEVIVAFWSNQFGPAAETLADRMKKAATEAKNLFFEMGGGADKLKLQALIDAQAIVQQGIGLDRAAAESAGAVRVATDRLVDSKRKQAEAQAQLIEAEAAAITKRQKLGELNPEVAEAQLADVARRAADVRKKTELEITGIRREGAKGAGEAAAAEIAATEKIRATIAQRRDAIIGLAKAELEARAGVTLGLDAAFAARKQLEDASTQQSLQALQAETAARKAAARESLADSPVALERELTQITQEETTKRTQILTAAITQSIALAQQERTERLAQAEQIFSIQRSLNQRTLKDDLETQAAIARSAEAGSKIQIAAVQKVAEMTKQLQDQGRAAITQGITLLQQQASRMGIEGPAFVSLSSIQEGIERQRQRDDLTRRQLQAGESVRTEDAQALASNPLEIFRQFGNDIGAASNAAFTPIAEQFKTIVGDGIRTEFSNLTSQVVDSFVGITTAVAPAFASLEKMFAQTFSNMKAIAEAGTSELALSITRMVSENLARSFVDAEKRF